MIDSLIYTGAILLILSQVAEKITTFIRGYLKAGLARRLKTKKKLPFTKRLRRFLKKGISWLLGNILILDNENDIRRGEIRHVPTSQKSNIEFAVTKLGLLVGFSLAFFFHADLFKMVGNDQPHQVMNWDNQFSDFWLDIWNITHNTEFYNFAWTHLKSNIWPCFNTLFGFLATGFLLTFGSKFFHDLLEILCEIKLARRQVSDEYLLRSRDIQTFDSRINSPLGDPVAMVLERHKVMLLRDFKSIVSIERAFDLNGDSVLEIRTLDDSQRTAINQYLLNYPDRDGDKVLSQTHVKIITGSPPVEIHSPLKLGIGNKVRPITASEDSFGTLGFFATRRSDKAKVFVTCAHVIDTDPQKIKKDGSIQVMAEDTDRQSPMQMVGGVVDFELSGWLDAAVVLLNEAVKAKNFDPERHQSFTQMRVLNWDDGSQVWVNGARSPMLEGKVSAHQNAVQVNYGQDVRTLYNLIRISDANSKAVTAPGDSGAIVFDKDMNAVGMIVAGNSEVSYAIPFHRVLNRLGLNILQPDESPLF